MVDALASALPMPNQKRPSWGNHVLLLPFVFFFVLTVMAAAKAMDPERTPVVLK